jgi:signal transduction histidine kinase
MLHELEYKKIGVLTSLKRNIRVLHSIILLIIFTLLLVSTRFLSTILNYIPEDSVFTLLAVISGLIIGAIYLIKKISDTAMRKLIAYSNEIDDLLIAKQQEITERKKAEEALSKAHNVLEKKVEERTADLSEINRELGKEIVERKHAEAVLEKLIQQKDMFITRLGHDLKTPLTPLIGLLPLIKKKGNGSETQNLLDACMQNVDRIKYLVIKAIKLARASSVMKETSMEDIPLMLNVNEYINKIDFMLKEKAIAVENNINPVITVNANEADLEELINNLISNAAKYTPEQGAIIIDAKSDNDMVTISVKDTGTGLDKKHIEHIFEEFYKVDESRHELTSSGLGLSICKKIVESHGGRIWAESRGEGCGTTFYFTLKTASRQENKP